MKPLSVLGHVHQIERLARERPSYILPSGANARDPKSNHRANLGQSSFKPAGLRRTLAPSSKLLRGASTLLGARGGEEHQARQAQLRRPFSCLRRSRLTSPRFVLEALGLQGSPKVGWGHAFGGVPSVRPLFHNVGSLFHRASTLQQCSSSQSA